MATNLRWGILGVSRIMDRMMPAWKNIRNGKLRALASRSLDKAQASAKANGIPKAHGSYEALLDDPEIDAVYIPLPNHLHAEYTKKAADRGKHVLCEKPLTPTAPEAAELVAYCRAKKIKLMDGFFWPHHPRTAAVKKFLQSGKIGPVQRVHGSFTFKMAEYDLGDFRLQPSMGGGGLLDVGCYPVYGIRWAFGEEPVRVWATAKYHNGVDVEMLGVLWFADGRMAQFDCGFSHPFRQWFEIVGTQGHVSIPDMWLDRKSAFEVTMNEEKTSESILVDGHCQMQCMLENFASYVLEDKPVVPDPSEAVKTLAVLDALLKSAKEGRVVEVSNPLAG